MTATTFDHSVEDIRNTVKEEKTLTQSQRLMFACYLTERRRIIRADGCSAGGAHPVEKIEDALHTVDRWLGKGGNLKERKKMRLHEISLKELHEGKRLCQPDASGALMWHLDPYGLACAALVVQEWVAEFKEHG